MEPSATFHDHYKQGRTPWETHRVDRALVDFIQKSALAPCAVLDAGCGTGSNAIWLAERGFKVSGWDAVAQAIDGAQQKAKKAGVRCNFQHIDLLKPPVPQPTFDFIFDRGLFHCFKSTHQLPQVVEIIASLLKQNGIWLSLIGNSDESRRKSGPPQLSASQITSLTEPLFSIESLSASFFDSDLQPAPKNWVCQMRKR